MTDDGQEEISDQRGNAKVQQERNAHAYGTDASRHQL